MDVSAEDLGTDGAEDDNSRSESETATNDVCS